MEYYLGLERRRLVVEWNGSEGGLVRTTLIRYVSRSITYKVQICLPRMPVNHSICMRRRLRRAWVSACGEGAAAARKISAVVRRLRLSNGLKVSDDVLVQLLEDLGLDNVAADIDLVGYHQSGSFNRRSLLFVFGFYPDDSAHYLNMTVIGRDSINYGRNGDLSL